MDAKHALEELLRVSDEVRHAVVFEPGKAPAASSLPDDEAPELAEAGARMLDSADALRPEAEVKLVRAVTPEGDVYVARKGKHAVVAVAEAGSTAGLVQHDLAQLLASVARRRRKAAAS